MFESAFTRKAIELVAVRVTRIIMTPCTHIDIVFTAEDLAQLFNRGANQLCIHLGATGTPWYVRIKLQ